MKFGVGTGQLKHLPPEPAIDFAAELGFEFFQWNPITKGEHNWSAKWNGDYDLDRLKKLGKSARRLGVPLTSMHLPYLPTPALDLDFIRKSITAAKAAGAKWLVTHPIAYGNYIDFFKTAADLCRAVNLNLLIENPSHKQEHIGIGIPTVYSPLQFLKLVRQSGANVCFDCNHATRVGLDPVEFYAMVAKFTKMIHISDSKSDLSEKHAPLGKGDIDFEKLFALIKTSRFDGPVVLELQNQYHSELENQLKILKKGLST